MLIYHKVALLSMAYIGTLSPANSNVYDLVVLSTSDFDIERSTIIGGFGQSKLP